MRQGLNPQLAPIAVDAARWRCPEVDGKAARVFAEQFPAPPPSRPLPDGKNGLDDDAKREWIDRAEALDGRKTAAGRSLLEDYKRCRGDGVATAAAETG